MRRYLYSGMKHNFFEEVYEVVKLIPKGRVTAYGDIAAYLGLRSGARAVGWALKATAGNHNIPAHRVVNRNGQLTGKHQFPYPEYMAEMLEAEGVKVKDDTVVAFDELRWLPANELL